MLVKYYDISKIFHSKAWSYLLLQVGLVSDYDLLALDSVSGITFSSDARTILFGVRREDSLVLGIPFDQTWNLLVSVLVAFFCHKGNWNWLPIAYYILLKTDHSVLSWILKLSIIWESAYSCQSIISRGENKVISCPFS